MPAARSGGPVRRALRASFRALGQLYRVAVTSGRWVILGLWIAAVAYITVTIPVTGGSGGNFGNLLPPESEVLQVEDRILEQFSVPVLSGTTVVVHSPDGLSLLTRADSVLWALATTQDVIQAPNPPIPGQIIAAIPVPTGVADTTVTYLYMSDGTGLHNTVRLANEYANHFHNQPSVGSYVTGFVPAQVAQGDYLRSRLGLFETASLLLITTIVALAFRSLLAPLVVVGMAVVGYLVYNPLLSELAGVFGFEVPSQLEPLLLALLLGVVTDYCVLFFAAFRHELDLGVENREAARRAVRRDASVIAVAGLCVAGGTISLLAAPFEIFRGLGPALALTVLVGLAVCLTLTPAVMTILGWRLFTVLPIRGSEAKQIHIAEGSGADKLMKRANLAIRLLTHRGPAFVAMTGVIILLALATLPVAQARLDLSFTAGLPKDDEVYEGAQLLDDAGLRGISAPTEILVEQPGVGQQRAALSRLQAMLESQPGVARVLGPDDTPLDKPRGVVLSRSGNAARYVVIFDSDPLAARAVTDARQLQSVLPGLASEAGLPEAELAMTGQTLIASKVAELTRDSLIVVLIVALVVELGILVFYLRALVAPVVLLLCSALSVSAALGLTTLVFQDFLGQQGLTFYAPFAAAVLLIALGSDYNVFAVGSIWNEAKRRPLSDALRIAVPRSSQAITIAGVILAGTFALVSIIPLATFRQIAFAMAVGLLIDTLIIRPVLTPAVLTMLGRWASWPSQRIARGEKMTVAARALDDPYA